MDTVEELIMRKLEDGPVTRDEIHRLPDGPQVARELMKRGLIHVNRDLNYQGTGRPVLRIAQTEEDD